MPVAYLKRTQPIIELWSRLKLRIRLNDALDIGSIMETHKEKKYTSAVLMVPANATIIDIGASIGDFSILCASWFENCKCFSFEPDKTAFKLCQKNISLNNFQNQIKCFPLAVSDKAGELVIGEDTFEAITLDQIFTDNLIDRCDLLKIDIEGMEYSMFKNMSKETLQHVNAITMECHEYPGCEGELSKLKLNLSEQGFHVETTIVSFHNVCHLYAFRQQ